MTPSWRVLVGDVREQLATLPDESVQMCVTSPPYWGLRDYGIDGQIGMEPTPDAYVEAMVEVFRGVRRVLHDSGTVWLNVGTSASRDKRPSPSLSPSRVPACGSDGTSPPGSQDADRACPDSCDESQGETLSRRAGNARNDQSDEQGRQQTSRKVRDNAQRDSAPASSGGQLPDAQVSTTPSLSPHVQDAFDLVAKALTSRSAPDLDALDALEKIHASCLNNTILKQKFKPKDLVMIPFMVAQALQQDGWWLRSVICWAKKSCMPESVTDRPTNSWEPIFLLSKQASYFYDAAAVKEKAESPEGSKLGMAGYSERAEAMGRAPSGNEKPGTVVLNGAFRNQRNVWHLGPEPYAKAHFATFPTEIPRRAILAGSKPGDTVLDPFLGSGTTGQVAIELGRNVIGIELNQAYADLARRRIGSVAPLFANEVGDVPDVKT